jgi:hypothetical protein
MGLPLFLGGTSNHFRMDALREIGFWDAYNVTEDAVLDLRPARAGYRAWTPSLRKRMQGRRRPFARRSASVRAG